ncbi:hypothetical protein [Pyrobaculum sp.]|uniref:hypothetical protein n=1 Tax=Pyrobaculum sp. TaxID=2004705 RepID=UPI003D128F22
MSAEWREIYIIKLNLLHPTRKSELFKAVNSYNPAVYRAAHRSFFHHPILGFISFSPPYDVLRDMARKHMEWLAELSEKYPELAPKLKEPFSYVYKFHVDRSALCRIVTELLNAYDDMYARNITRKSGSGKTMRSIAREKAQQLLEMYKLCDSSTPASSVS